jgi:hypothetical protein
VNDTAFIDPYLLAKQNRARRECALLGPLVQVERETDSHAFEAIDDHFRYLWDLDLSVYCQDATFYESGLTRSLSRLKPPTAVLFDGKASLIKRKKPDLTDEAIVRWKSRAQRVLNRFCIEPASTPGAETLFITCSWRTEEGQAIPNDYAVQLSSHLEGDFGRKRDEALLSVFIMEAATGEFFSQQLYARLDESTLGLVLLTADVEGTDGGFYSRPNVYHELGYLMKQLGGTRVAIVCESGVTVPSNISDVMRIDFERDKLILAYAKVAGWVIRSSGLGVKVREEAERNIRDRLDQAVMEGQVSPAECEKAKQRIRNYFQDGRRRTAL